MQKNFNWSHHICYYSHTSEIFILIDLKSVSQLFIAIISCLFPATSAFPDFLLSWTLNFFTLLDFISSLQIERQDLFGGWIQCVVMRCCISQACQWDIPNKPSLPPQQQQQCWSSGALVLRGLLPYCSCDVWCCTLLLSSQFKHSASVMWTCWCKWFEFIFSCY